MSIITSQSELQTLQFSCVSWEQQSTKNDTKSAQVWDASNWRPIHSTGKPNYRVFSPPLWNLWFLKLKNSNSFCASFILMLLQFPSPGYVVEWPAVFSILLVIVCFWMTGPMVEEAASVLSYRMLFLTNVIQISKTLCSSVCCNQLGPLVSQDPSRALLPAWQVSVGTAWPHCLFSRDIR